MTKVMIVPVPAATGRTSYLAVAGDKQSVGDTAGAALDALTDQLEGEETGTLVILQTMRPDAFFSAAQQQQLATLMDEWRTARNTGGELPVDKQRELEALVEAELLAATARTTALLDEIGQ
ncbi:MAG: hypothetical protein R3E79_13685 [Caldilineaceae bacterium]